MWYYNLPLRVALNPACTALEAVATVDWATQILGLDKMFYNFFQGRRRYHRGQTGTSDPGLVAIESTRSRYMSQDPEVLPEKLVMYTTTQTLVGEDGSLYTSPTHCSPSSTAPDAPVWPSGALGGVQSIQSSHWGFIHAGLKLQLRL
ncbi:hypothetical protein BU15DRAFT_61404 [Melanogaster broomeanus]|nr:hypothetical protein BU15DRAFT_61404 [Melanogaster broomeanus]